MTISRFALSQARPLIEAVHREQGAFVAREHDEALHDMRTAVRRLRSVLRGVRGVYGREATQPIDAALAEAIDPTSSVRDAEVQVVLIDDLLADEPLASTLRRWAGEHRSEASSLEQALRRAFDTDVFGPVLERLEELLAAPPDDDPKARRYARERGRREVRRFARQLSRLGKHPDDIEAMHRLRLAAKRLRYVIEFFKPLLGDGAIRAGREARGLQGSLGDLRDVDVLDALVDTDPRLGVEDRVRFRELIAARRKRLARTARKQIKRAAKRLT